MPIVRMSCRTARAGARRGTRCSREPPRNRAPAAVRLARHGGAAARTHRRSRGVRLPVTLDNCGTEVTFEAARERVVTIKSATLEMLLALGLEDAWSARRSPTVPCPRSGRRGVRARRDLRQGPRQEARSRPSPTSSTPAGSRASRPTVRATATARGARHRDVRRPGRLQGRGLLPDPLTFDEVFGEIREAAAIFAFPSRAELVATRAPARRGRAERRGPTALWYSSGDDTPYVGAGIGAPQMILDAAGLENIAADVDDTWTSIGWEPIVAADPDVIVLVDAAWNTADQKIELLESNPATSAHRRPGARYLVVPFPAAEAGVRNVGAVASLDDQLAELDLLMTHRRGRVRPARDRAAVGPRPGGGPAGRRRTRAPVAAARARTRLRIGAWAAASAAARVSVLVAVPSARPTSASRRSGAACSGTWVRRADARPLHDAIVWELRLPRVLTAAAVGAGLASRRRDAGITRNPLADPTCWACRRGRRSGPSPCWCSGRPAPAGRRVRRRAPRPRRHARARERGGRAHPARTVLAGLAVSALAAPSRAS